MSLDKRPSTVRSNLVRMFRDPPGPPIDGSKPAPDWAWKLIDAALERTGNAGLTFELLTWCQEGNPEDRSEHLRELIRLWRGPREAMLRAFLEAAKSSGAGRVGPTRKPREPSRADAREAIATIKHMQTTLAMARSIILCGEQMSGQAKTEFEISFSRSEKLLEEIQKATAPGTKRALRLLPDVKVVLGERPATFDKREKLDVTFSMRVKSVERIPAHHVPADTKVEGSEPIDVPAQVLIQLEHDLGRDEPLVSDLRIDAKMYDGAAPETVFAMACEAVKHDMQDLIWTAIAIQKEARAAQEAATDDEQGDDE